MPVARIAYHGAPHVPVAHHSGLHLQQNPQPLAQSRKTRALAHINHVAASQTPPTHTYTHNADTQHTHTHNQTRGGVAAARARARSHRQQNPVRCTAHGCAAQSGVAHTARPRGTTTPPVDPEREKGGVEGGSPAARPCVDRDRLRIVPAPPPLLPLRESEGASAGGAGARCSGQWYSSAHAHGAGAGARAAPTARSAAPAS